MTYGILDIFISSKERSELTDDRLIAQSIIQEIGFEVINSENRHADSNSMESENINEVMACDIYLGILGECYSSATIKEFETARANNKDVLILSGSFRIGTRSYRNLLKG